MDVKAVKKKDFSAQFVSHKYINQKTVFWLFMGQNILPGKCFAWLEFKDVITWNICFIKKIFLFILYIILYFKYSSAQIFDKKDNSKAVTTFSCAAVWHGGLPVRYSLCLLQSGAVTVGACALCLQRWLDIRSSELRRRYRSRRRRRGRGSGGELWRGVALEPRRWNIIIIARLRTRWVDSFAACHVDASKCHPPQIPRRNPSRVASCVRAGRSVGLAQSAIAHQPPLHFCLTSSGPYRLFLK